VECVNVVEEFKDMKVRSFDLRVVCTELYRKRQPGNKMYIDRVS